MSDEITPEMEDIVIQAAEDMGAPRDLFLLGYGWIIRDGEATEEGLRFYRENEKYFKKETV